MHFVAQRSQAPAAPSKLCLDFRWKPSGGDVMPDAPTGEDATSTDPESKFLIELWDHLDSAYTISVNADVMGRLDDIRRHCEAAMALIQRCEGVQL